MSGLAGSQEACRPASQLLRAAPEAEGLVLRLLLATLTQRIRSDPMADAATPVGADQAILPPSGEQVVEAPAPTEVAAAPSTTPEEGQPAVASEGPSAEPVAAAEQPTGALAGCAGSANGG